MSVATTPTLLTVELRREPDVVLARQRARDISSLLGFDAHEQTRFATAVSEIARNAFRYAREGRVEFLVDGVREDGENGPPQQVVARVTDRGPGVRELDAVLGGTYVSATGMGLGIIGTRRLVDRFDLVSSSDGTTVTMGRTLPRRSATVTRATIARVSQELARRVPDDPVAELQTQNQELLRTLDTVRAHQSDIERLNGELEETNRGVLALYAELDERATALKRASELKSSFLANASHELRTPLTSILNISRLMHEYGSADLSEEQRKQIAFIRSSAQTLADIVNDLLDLAKIESGRVDVRPSMVSVTELFGTLRGMFRPLVPNDTVSLVFDDPASASVYTDEGKLAQILRNFISNALKYTERGEVRVSVGEIPGDTIAFTVADTGIGIPPEYQERIFEEFVQVEGTHQKHVKGTGLGLPLSRQLARLLGGTITLTSTLGQGSAFVLAIPREDLRMAGASGARSPERHA